jgi:hypothetical protein
MSAGKREISRGGGAMASVSRVSVIQRKGELF